MKLIGLDVSLNNVGVAVSQKDRLLFLGTIKNTSKRTRQEKLLNIANELERILESYKPNLALVEYAVLHRSIYGTLAVGEAIGVVRYILARRNIDVREISPTSIKLATSGRGRASKMQVMFMVKRMFNLKESINEHEADALALIATYLSRNDIRT